MESTAKPSLRIAGLHIEGLKALRKVDWPADGMGWNGRVPDLLMIGGINGSGKTTLLEFLSDAIHALLLATSWSGPPEKIVNAWLDLELSSSVTGAADLRLVLGDAAFVGDNRSASGLAMVRGERFYSPEPIGEKREMVRQFLSDREAFGASDFPSIVYLPTERRLVIPEESYKAAGKLNGTAKFRHCFRPATKWSESTEALLYAARWADLNAKEEGRPEEATHFQSYVKAFEGFFRDTKTLVWEGGELFVRIADTGALHPLTELSSGEKQALVLAAELYRHWRPGSLILIDEPELHFHSSWQTALWLMLEAWQKERGGQVIVATQSTHLFSIAPPGSTVLLGKGLA